MKIMVTILMMVTALCQLVTFMVTASCQLVTFMVTAFVPVGDLYGHGLVPVSKRPFLAMMVTMMVTALVGQNVDHPDYGHGSCRH